MGQGAYPVRMENRQESAGENQAQTPGAKCPVPKWGRRLGAAAFMFFLIKGLLWLTVPALVAMGLFAK